MTKVILLAGLTVGFAFGLTSIAIGPRTTIPAPLAQLAAR